jgi:hypothetical protein
MKYRKKNIDVFLEDKNWEGVKRFTNKYSFSLFIMLEKIRTAKDFEALKDFVKTFSIEPVLEYGLPVGGEGVKELYDISDRYHSHKHKVGAEWWVRDEVDDLIRQLKGFSSENEILDRIALIWKNVDTEINSEPRLKERAFKKILMKYLIEGIYKAEFKDEEETMKEIEKIFEISKFFDALGYNEEYME